METVKSPDWKNTKSKIKNKFSKLSDSDISSLEGHMDKLPTRLEKVYGYSKEKAKTESEAFTQSMKKKAV